MNLKNCVALIFLALSLASCAHDDPVKPSKKATALSNSDNLESSTHKDTHSTAEANKKKYIEEGYASWYGKFFHGRKTASGPRYDMHEYTAAHRSLPLPSVVKVINLENRKSVMVVVNDRGPYYNGENKRIIDMSKKAAKELGFLKKGVAKVKVEYLPNETKRLKSKLKPSQYHKAISKYKDLITKDTTTTVAKANLKS